LTPLISQRRAGGVLGGQATLSYIGYLALAAIVAAWAWRAFHDAGTYDTGAAYEAGQLAWATGHPETLYSWTGMPSLAAAMAIVSRVISIRAAADLVTVINVVVVVGVAVVVLSRIRPLLSPVWWWIVAFALLAFAPLMSTVWWKQFNVIALVLALGGFELIRRRRVAWGAAAIGCSIALKPMVILLPFVLLARRETRRAGAFALAWVVGLNVAAQALMAERAGDLATLNPFLGLRNLLHKSQSNLFLCFPGNFSPSSMICHAASAGFQYWTLERILAGCVVVLLGAWVVLALRGHSILSWEVFAFVCALSAMTGPFEWPHYQVMLAPLFLVLVIAFNGGGASAGEWLGLAFAFVLASLLLEPYGTVYGTLRHVFTGVTETHNSLSGAPELTFQEGIAQYAQYVLIVTGVLWYVRRRPPGTSPAITP